MILLLIAPVTVPATVQAADTDTVYYTKTGKKYHSRNCKTISGHKIWSTTKAQARQRGLTACAVCSGGTPSSSSSSSSSSSTTRTTSSTSTASTTSPANAKTAATTTTPQTSTTSTTPQQTTSTSSTISAAQAAQQAYALYVQNGLDSGSAMTRVQNKLAEITAQPGNVAQIVQNDLAALTAAASTNGNAATGLSATDAVQKAFALYVQSGMDIDSAMSRVQSKLAEFAAQPNSFAQIVQNDLASVGTGASTAASGLSVNDAVQQAYALYVQSGIESNSALARVQNVLTQIAGQPDAYAQIVANDLAAQN